MVKKSYALFCKAHSLHSILHHKCASYTLLQLIIDIIQFVIYAKKSKKNIELTLAPIFIMEVIAVALYKKASVVLKTSSSTQSQWLYIKLKTIYSVNPSISDHTMVKTLLF